MKLLLMSGGSHPYEESTPVLKGFLESAGHDVTLREDCLLYTSPSPRDRTRSRMPSSA